MRTVLLFVLLLFYSAAEIASAQDSLNILQVGLVHDYWDYAQSVTVVDTLAYLGTRDSGLRIVSIADPFQPTEIGYLPIDGALHVIVSGTSAYVTNEQGQTGLWVVDISNPAAPWLTGFCPRTLSSRAMDKAGDYLYIADSMEGMLVFDVTDPANPTELPISPPTPRGYDIAVVGPYAYLASNYDGLYVFDVSDPGVPVEVGHYDTERNVRSLAVRDHLAFVGDGGYFTVLDISRPDSMFALGAMPLSSSLGFGIELVGNYAYLLDTRRTLRVVDITDPTNLVALDSLETPGEATQFEIQANYAYIADEFFSGLRVIDISNPAELTQVGSLEPHRLARSIAISGPYLYVGERRGLRVMNVSDPTNPIEIGGLPIPEDVEDIALYEGFAFLAEQDSGLEVVDISNPLAPLSVGRFVPENRHSISSVYVENGLAYAVGSDGLTMLDVIDPSAPAQISHLHLSGAINDIVVVGDLAYLAGWSSGLHVVDVSNVAEPVEIGSWMWHYPQPQISASKLAILGNYVYMTGQVTGLHVVDVSNPQAPFDVAYYELPGTRVVTIADHYVYTSSWEHGLVMFDISDPFSPVISGYYDAPGAPRHIAVAGIYAYTAELSYVGIYDCYDAVGVDEGGPHATPRSITLHPCYPNPFNPETTLRFDLPQAKRVLLTVYNVAGQAVETLVNEQMSAGTHTVTFDGTRFSSGIYFSVLRTEGSVETRKIVLLK
jgi:hypothetical protein